MEHISKNRNILATSVPNKLFVEFEELAASENKKKGPKLRELVILYIEAKKAEHLKAEMMTNEIKEPEAE